MTNWIISLLEATVFVSAVGLFLWFSPGKLAEPVQAATLWRLLPLLLFFPFPAALTGALKNALADSPWGAGLFALWVGGALARLGFFFTAQAGFLRTAALTKVQPEEKAALLLAETARRIGVSPPKLLRGKMLFPLLSPFSLLIPADLEDENTLACHFCHMLVHRRKNDWFFFFLWRMAAVFHWFNPLIWRFLHREEALREAVCHQTALFYLPDEQKILYRRLFADGLSAKNNTFYLV